MKKERIIISAQIILSIGLLIAAFCWRYTFCHNMTDYVEWSSEEYASTDTSEFPVIEINTIQDWFQFTSDVNSGEKNRGYIVSLNSDLDFDRYAFEPIGSEETPFEGIFLGNGHILKNIKIHSTEKYTGLFGYVQYASISGVNLNTCEIYSSESRGTGGIAGYASNTVITDCVFDGQIIAEDGSAGGIVGDNRSVIDSCVSHGKIIGTTATVYQGQIYFRTGGIAGDNVHTIRRCTNYAEVYTGENDPSNYISGGISGSNYGTIESCTNYGYVNGGGIAYSNDDASVIRGCYNFGEVYAGIVVSGSNSIIEYCVNLGPASGRYAADIVSFCESSEDYWLGTVTQCLFINTSGTGVTRSRDYDKDSLIYNYQIMPLAEGELEHLVSYLEKGSYPEAFHFILLLEKQRRTVVWHRLVLGIIALVLLVDGGRFFRRRLGEHRSYSRARTYMKQGDYHTAFALFSKVLHYRDGHDCAKHCLAEYLRRCTESGIFEMGIHENHPILWNAVRRENGEYILLSQYALIASQIHSSPEPVVWADSEAYHRLNDNCRFEWFNEVEREFLSGDISIMSLDDVQAIFGNSEERKCKSISPMRNVLSGSGNVFWWLRFDGSAAVSKMPFVTDKGLISERGKSITETAISIRPVIRIRIDNEDN